MRKTPKSQTPEQVARKANRTTKLQKDPNNTDNSNIEKLKMPKNKNEDYPMPKYLEEYRDCFTFTMRPLTQAFLDRISSELIQWATHNEDALKVSQFYLSKGIPMNTYYNWLEKYPDFKEAHEIAMQLIGNRREVGGLKRKFDAGIVSYTMSHYDKTWKDMAKEKSELKMAEAAENKNETKVIILENFESLAALKKDNL